jgi:hypothetical protein
MSSVQSVPLFRENIEVGCDCFNPNVVEIIKSVSAFNYVYLKKDYVQKYLTNIVIHKSKDLIGLKKCYGKQRTNSRLLRSSYRSHQLTLKKFKEYISTNNLFKNIFIKTTSLSVEKYIQTAEALCKTFDIILSIEENRSIEIDLVVKSCHFQLQTLNILEKVIETSNNGGSNAPLQYKSIENETIQLV